MKKFRRHLWWTATVAGLLFAPAFVCSALMEMNYFSNRPREPHPDINLTVPYVVKNNVVVYVTPTQATVSNWLFRFYMAMLTILALSGTLAGGLDLSRPQNSN
jgi:hypothetical protein